MTGTDTDKDGLPDDIERQIGSHFKKPDTDGDGLKDGEEYGYWGLRYSEDPDGDGLINILDKDSDNDGFWDGLEVAQKTDPADPLLTPAGQQTVVGGRGSSPKSSKTISAAAAIDRKTAPAALQPGGITIFADSEISSEFTVDWDAYNAMNGEARIATGDIDGDKKDEIVIGLGPVEGNPAIPGGRFQIIDDDLSALGWGQVDWSDYNSANGETWPACGDIDGDGIDEILIGLGIGGNGRVEIFKFKKGEAVHVSWLTSGWEDYCLAGGGVRPACGNIDLDRRDEIVLGLYPAGDIFPSEGRFEVLDNSGRHLAWGAVDWPEYTARAGETRPACGNIDLSGRDEILLGLGAGSGGRIPVYSYALGSVRLRTWLQAGIPEYRELNGETRIACGDVDLDARDEILIGFGRGGRGLMELREDEQKDFRLLSRLQVIDEDYNSVSGELYPAFKGMKCDIPWVIELFLKARMKKMLP